MSERTQPACAGSEPTEAEPSEPPSRLVVDVVLAEGAWGPMASIEAAIATAVAALAAARPDGPADAEACIALSDDVHVRDLNRTWRNQDKPTNVLSFPAPEWATTISSFPTPEDAADTGTAPAAFIGDVILAADTVHREADAMGIPRLHHIQHLVVHGLLHLLGYDHETEAEAARMEGLETRVLASLGIPDPYADRDAEAGP